LRKRPVILRSLLIVATPYLDMQPAVSLHGAYADTGVAAYPMWWLHVVASFKLQVSFAEYRLFYRALLQKRPIILRRLLIVATPYLHMRHVVSSYILGKYFFFLNTRGTQCSLNTRHSRHAVPTYAARSFLLHMWHVIFFISFKS